MIGMLAGIVLWFVVCSIFRFPKIIGLIGAVPAAILGVVASFALFFWLDKHGKI